MLPAFQPFAVEQYLSETEHAVRYNFSESGVHPLRYNELFELAEVDTARLFAQLVDYPQVNGFQSLREEIAALYANASAENVLVTAGASEANTLVAATLLQTGDHLVRFHPSYEQLSGHAHNLGFEVRSTALCEARQWAMDASELDAVMDDHSGILHVVNPHNPTGKILSRAERETLIACAEKHGAWLVADEVYIGTERHTDAPVATFWGATDRAIIINSMSKAYGLPGLRIGWIIAPQEIITACWRRHEYAAIAACHLSMRLAEFALRPSVRDKLRARARRLIRRGFDLLKVKLDEHPGVFSVVPPDASAMSFVKFDLPVTSDQLAMRLLQEEDVLVIPGSKFGMDNHFRFSSALEEPHLLAGLDRLNRVVEHILDGS